MGGTMLRHNYNTTTRLPLSAVYSSFQLTRVVINSDVFREDDIDIVTS